MCQFGLYESYGLLVLEHDLLGLLASAGSEAVLVESNVVMMHGCATIALRVGWEEPIWLYLDPAIGFAPRRIDRCLSTTMGRVLIRTELEDLHDVGGLWLPGRMVLTQHLLDSSWFEAGDDPERPWYLKIESTLDAYRWNQAVDWGAWGLEAVEGAAINVEWEDVPVGQEAGHG